MKFETLQSALKPIGDQIRITAKTLHDDKLSAVILQPFFGDTPLIITGRSTGQPPSLTPGANASQLVIEGQANFPFLHFEDPSALPTIQATFELKNIDRNGEGQVTVTLKYFLPKAWRFQASFPKLPIVPDFSADFAGEQSSLLDRLKFLDTNDLQSLDACFVLATDRIDDHHYDIPLDPGLNFVGRWDATGMLGVLENLFPAISKQLVLFGAVVLPSAANPAALLAGQFAWDTQPVVPGIHLQARLSILPSFGKIIQFGEVVCRLYSPMTSDWLAVNATYQPVMAYLCEIRVPSANNMKATLAAKKQCGEDNLLAAVQFQGANVTNLFNLLSEVAHGDFTGGIPSNVTSYLKDSKLGNLELETTAAMLVPRGSSYRVAYTYFTLGMPHLEWSIFENILTIHSLWTEILVFNPFELDESRTIAGTIIGLAEVLGFKLQVMIQLPDLLISAEQIEAKTVPLKELFAQFLPDIPPPANLIIDRLTIVAKPGVYYTFSMSSAGDPPWTIQLGQESNQSLVIEDIEFSLSKDVGITGSVAAVLKFEKLAAPAALNGVKQDVQLFVSASVPISSQNGWQFEGSTGPGQEIPIGNLIAWLGQKFGAVPPPTAIEKLTIENLRLSFNTQSKDFTFTLETRFPVDSQELDMVVVIEIKRQQDNTYSKHFSAKITVAKMKFDVIFDSRQGTTAFIAAFNNPEGEPIKIQELLSNVSSNIDVPDSLEFKIKDALLAYQSKQPPPANTTVKNYLFGLDIDGGLNLSDLKLPDLPLVGSLLPPDQTLKLSFQLLASKEDFTVGEVTALSALLPTGPKLPNKAINARLDLSTVLQIGQESKSLELQIGVNSKPDAQNTGLVPAPAKKELVAGPAASPESSDTKAIVTSSAPSAANVQGADGLQWITIQKTFGPVQFERIGLAYKDGNITGALDAALIAGPLTISLSGLSVTSPLTKFDPVFDLHGLGIDYRNGPLEIGGAFLKQTITPALGKSYTVFSGLAVIRTEKLSISAIGSYTSIKDAQNNDHASMFIYAVLDYPIGGPAFFYITGLAAGFGYNRALNMPTIDTLAAFPLVEEATRSGGPPQLPATQQAQQDTITTELAKLETYIPPAIGENFLAIGIKFTSFKIIDSFALLVVKFGNRLEFDLLGLSKMQSPPPEAGGQAVTPVAKATLALKATFIPDEGFLSVQAQLTSDSYILDQACHLTGGFAFFSWFKDTEDADGNKISAGDFVLTLGGYHPDYVIPAHYPRVPRLGISWQVNDQLSIKGDGYFALTPHAFMAGGHLEALWHSSDNSLRAWFKVGADFLISWKPYHYDARIYVDIGASYTFDFFGNHTISVDLGADLHIWGPDFSGTATVHYCLFSLSVDFGSGSAQKLEPISWDSFKKSFLPADQKQANQYQVCSVAVQNGLVRQIEENGMQRWIVNPKDFVLVTNSAIPVKSASNILGKEDTQTKKRPKKEISLGKAPQPFAIAPMGLAAEKISSEHIITIKRGEEYLSDEFVYVPIHKAVPAALWGEPEMDGDSLKPPKVNPSSAMVPDTLAGFEIRPVSKSEATGDPVEMQASNYDTQTLESAYQFAPEMNLLASSIHAQQAWDQADADLTRPEVRKIQQDFIEVLRFPATALDYGESVKQDLMMR